MAPKRKETDSREICKYGPSCYRKNPEHLKKFKHTSDEKTSKDEDKKQNATESVAGIPESEKKHEKGDIAQHLSVTSSKEAKKQKENDITQYLTVTPCKDKKQSIKEKFLVEMPQDFFDFWDFCKSLQPENPETALHIELGLILVGPFDVLSGKLENCKVNNDSDFLCHWRYYYDPPEFLTVMKRDGPDLFHIGYYRDEPSELPKFVAWNEAGKNCFINPVGSNLFAAVNLECDSALKTSNESLKKKLKTLQNKVQEYSKVKKHSLEKETKEMKTRKRKIVSPTFHKGGIMVKVENHVGYRPLPESNATLQRMLKKIIESKTEGEKNQNFAKLHEIFTFVQFANDECDYGMGLELGLDLFSFGDPTFHKMILSLLPIAYDLLNRPEYGTIIKAHLKDRRSGENISIIH